MGNVSTRPAPEPPPGATPFRHRIQPSRAGPSIGNVQRTHALAIGSDDPTSSAVQAQPFPFAGEGRLPGQPTAPARRLLPSRKENASTNRRLRRKRAEVRHLAEQAASDSRLNFPDTSWLPPYVRTGFSHLPIAPLSTDERAKEECSREEAPRTHFPAADLMKMAQLHFTNINREQREIRKHGILSEQFPDYKGLSGDGIDISGIAPVHSASDPTLLPGSKKKRLPLATSAAANEVALNSDAARTAGRLLAQAFHDGRNYPHESQPFDENLFLSCIAENDFAKLTNKTRAFLLASSEKSDPDWRYTSVRIFVKSQQKVNPSTINGPWKACQTLAQFTDQWLLIFGPAVRYVSKQDARMCPPNVFRLAGHTAADANEWSKRYIKTKRATTNDYTAFDQSQTAEAVEAECIHMSWWGIPDHLITMYRHQKTHLKHQFGTSRIMRFTGEPGTYEFNSFFSEGLCYLQYDFPPDWPRAHSGDDTLFPGHLKERASWQAIKHLFSVTAKTELLENYGTFCGYIYSPWGIIREPETIAIKLAIAIEQGRFDKVAEGYAQEIAIGNLMGDQAYEVLTPEQLEWRAAAGQALFTRGDAVVRSLLASPCLDDVSAPYHEILIRHGAAALSQLRRRERLAAYALYVPLKSQALSD